MALKRNHDSSYSYVAKIEENGKTRYFYTLPEYRAYLEAKKSEKQSQASTVQNKPISSVVSNASKNSSNVEDTSVGYRPFKTTTEYRNMISKNGYTETTTTYKEKETTAQKLINNAIELGQKIINALAGKTIYEIEGDEDAERNKTVRETTVRRDNKTGEETTVSDKKRDKKGRLVQTIIPDMSEDNTSETTSDKTNPKTTEDGKDEHGIYLKTKEYTADEDMALINPDYDPSDDDDGYENNCWSCTVSYLARRRGYDVEAVPDPECDGELVIIVVNYFGKSYNDIVYPDTTNKYIYDNNSVINKGLRKGGLTESEYSTVLDNAQKAADDLIKSIDDANSNEGMLFMQYGDAFGGGGHVIAYDRDLSGKLVFRDCQTNEIVELTGDNGYCTLSQQMYFVDTTNAELSDKAFTKAMRNRRWIEEEKQAEEDKRIEEAKKEAEEEARKKAEEEAKKQAEEAAKKAEEESKVKAIKEGREALRTTYSGYFNWNAKDKKERDALINLLDETTCEKAYRLKELIEETKSGKKEFAETSEEIWRLQSEIQNDIDELRNKIFPKEVLDRVDKENAEKEAKKQAEELLKQLEKEEKKRLEEKQKIKESSTEFLKNTHQFFPNYNYTVEYSNEIYDEAEKLNNLFDKSRYDKDFYMEHYDEIFKLITSINKMIEEENKRR